MFTHNLLSRRTPAVKRLAGPNISLMAHQRTNKLIESAVQLSPPRLALPFKSMPTRTTTTTRRQIQGIAVHPKQPRVTLAARRLLPILVQPIPQAVALSEHHRSSPRQQGQPYLPLLHKREDAMQTARSMLLLRSRNLLSMTPEQTMTSQSGLKGH